MSLWSKIKSAVKTAWRAVKAGVRIVVRIVVGAAFRFSFGLADLFLGFFAWPRKRLRLHVFILSASTPGGEPTSTQQVVPTQEVLDAIARTQELYKTAFNVDIRSWAKTFIEVIPEPPPPEVLDLDPGIDFVFGTAGEWFNDHLAGWNGIPISVTFPITVFVIREVKGAGAGVSLNIFGDYVVIDHEGLTKNSSLALGHEIGHTCGLSPGLPDWHDWTPLNLMFAKLESLGNNVKWFQKNILRSSRHVQYW
jgi:hypothetical protein